MSFPSPVFSMKAEGRARAMEKVMRELEALLKKIDY